MFCPRVYMHITCLQCLHSPEEGPESPGTGVTVGSEQETKPSSSVRAVSAPHCWATPAPHSWVTPQDTSSLTFLNEKQVKCTPSALWVLWKATTLSYGKMKTPSVQQKQDLTHIWNLKFPSYHFKNIPVKVTLIFYILLIIWLLFLYKIIYLT